MQKTQVYSFDNDVVGYMVNTPLSIENQNEVRRLQEKLETNLPNTVWSAPAESLHITLLDWIAPLVDYSRDKDELYELKYSAYDNALETALKDIETIQVTFDEIVAFPNAVIIRGHDDGSYAKIRQTFVDNAELLEGTKQPPSIIHCSIARFKKDIDFEKVGNFVSSLGCDIRHTTKEFRLVRETADPMLEFKTIKTYRL